MKFLLWLLQFFQPPAKAPRAVKFVEGTQWTCPACRGVLLTAKRDIYYGGIASSRDWDRALAYEPIPIQHCGVRTIRVNEMGHHEIHTPTGWVG